MHLQANPMVGYINDSVLALESDARKLEGKANFARAEVSELRDRVTLIRGTLDENHLNLGPSADGFYRRVTDVDRRVSQLSAAPRAAPKQMQQVVVDEDAIRDTFYNKMGLIAFTEQFAAADLKKEEVKILLSARTLIESMLESKEYLGAIRLHNGVLLTEGICPAAFKRLHAGMLATKDKIAKLSEAELRLLDNALTAPAPMKQEGLALLAGPIMLMAAEICKRAEFKIFFMNLQEAKGTIASSHAPTPESLKGVTAELIRQNFYKIMIDHAKTHKLIPQQAYVDQDGYIFFALTAHTLLEVLLDSQHLVDAIALSEGKSLNLANCPDDFLPLARVILGLKKEIPFLTPEQILMIKYSSIDDDAVIVPKEALEAKTDNLILLYGLINNAAAKVSEFENFHKMITEVIKEICKEPEPSPNKT